MKIDLTENGRIKMIPEDSMEELQLRNLYKELIEKDIIAHKEGHISLGIEIPLEVYDLEGW